MSPDTVMFVYYSCFQSVTNYGIIFWGNSSHSICVFILQKRVVGIITGSKYRESYIQLFKKIKDFTISIAVYIF
jgi:hypothetical protein